MPPDPTLNPNRNLNPNPNPNPDLSSFGNRIIDLSGGQRGLRGSISITASIPVGIDDAVIDFRASDETLDRYDEIVTAKGWQLDNYRRNPVIQNAHQYGDIIHTIGRSPLTEIREGFLFMRAAFAASVHPIAKLAYDMYKGGFLNAVSVGFIPLDWENGSKEAGYRRKYTRQDLLEVSAVGIPANPNALALAIKSGAVAKSDLRELHQFLKHFCNEQAGSQSDPSARGLGSDGADLLQLSKDVAEWIRRTK